MGAGPQQQMGISGFNNNHQIAMDVIGPQPQISNCNEIQSRSQILDRNKYYRILIAKSGSQLTISNLNLHFPIVMDIIAPQFQKTIYKKENFNHKCSLNLLQ